MGKLIQGKWVVGDVATTSDSGSYERIKRSFRDVIGNDHPRFQPESGRYHLYVSYACPWAHRTLIFRKLKSLEPHISVSVVSPDMLEDGWIFDPSFEGATKDHLFEYNYLRDVYTRADSNISTSVTVPILWDKKHNTIVNNESSEIIRIFNQAFDALTHNKEDFYPQALHDEIDQWNERIYESINNGVYKSGFAKTQSSYDKAVKELFATLDELENHLEGKDYLVGDQLTEADLRLLPTLIRFDPVYQVHFKCSRNKISEFKNLSRYLQMHCEVPAVKETTNLKHIVRHYYYSHDQINPYRIIPNVL